MVQIVLDIPEDLVDEIEDIMTTYELTIDEFVETAIRRSLKKRTPARSVVSSALCEANTI